MTFMNSTVSVFIVWAKIGGKTHLNSEFVSESAFFMNCLPLLFAIVLLNQSAFIGLASLIGLASFIGLATMAQFSPGIARPTSEEASEEFEAQYNQAVQCLDKASHGPARRRAEEMLAKAENVWCCKLCPRPLTPSTFSKIAKVYCIRHRNMCADMFREAWHADNVAFALDGTEPYLLKDHIVLSIMG